MHELSIGTWFIHILTLLEWLIAIVLIAKISKTKNNSKVLIWLGFAMLPNLASAMAAITWHIFDNANSLYGLVYLQALLTFFGNCCLALSAWILVKTENKQSMTT